MEPLPAGTTSRRATTRWRLWRTSWSWSRRAKARGGWCRPKPRSTYLKREWRGPEGAEKAQRGGFGGGWGGGKGGREVPRHSAVVRPAPEGAAGTKTRDWE